MTKISVKFGQNLLRAFSFLNCKMRINLYRPKIHFFSQGFSHESSEDSLISGLKNFKYYNDKGQSHLRVVTLQKKKKEPKHPVGLPI